MVSRGGKRIICKDRAEGSKIFGNDRAEREQDLCQGLGIGGAGSLVSIGQREKRIFCKDRTEGSKIYGKDRADGEQDLCQ